MRIFLSDEEITQLIQEDVPFLDLTTYGLNIGKELGEIEFSTRHPMTICATEEAARVFEKCGAKVEYLVASGTCLTEQQLILKASGCAEALHIGWRVALNLMEYSSGIATRARQLVDAAKNINPDVAVVTTRKCFPGTRIISMKAILAGGATHLEKLDNKYKDEQINCLANHSILARTDNNKIKDQAPSKYRNEMPADTHTLAQILATHFCPEMLFEDDYDSFLSSRAELLLENAKELSQLS
jgi:nicotinate-nucleotide pyrophosphorylase